MHAIPVLQLLAAILAVASTAMAHKPTHHPVHIPEYNGKCMVRQLQPSGGDVYFTCMHNDDGPQLCLTGSFLSRRAFFIKKNLIEEAEEDGDVNEFCPDLDTSLRALDAYLCGREVEQVVEGFRSPRLTRSVSLDACRLKAEEAAAGAEAESSAAKGPAIFRMLRKGRFSRKRGDSLSTV